ncbi:MAG: aminotransferase class I/II-fold pyridoxal phosphate-dependent enzyme [Deltaproteobacteria bacterium]|nr:aminotransferase class I/II-fold pyridoxal phosphate-dependent enzyme [Deltaproteobacteria bacterium]
MDLFEKCRSFQDAKTLMGAGLYPFFKPIEASQGSTVTTHGTKRVMIGSNNYLGLTHHPRVMAAAKRAIDEFGTGCTGSRFLNGNLVSHERLEESLAKFLGKEACLVFSTGFLANQGSLSCLVGRNDAILSDRENHASIIEGTRLAVGETIRFPHNDMDALDRILTEKRAQYDGVLIVADGVFSMSGEIVDLPGLVKIASKHNCKLYIDDAHSLGVLGELGRGTGAHFGLTDEVDLIMGTFSKSFASIGGFIAGDADTIHYIKHKARPFMFSAAMPPSAVATVQECLNVIHEEPQIFDNLWKNARKMKRELSGLGFDTLASQTPIIPVVIGDDVKAFSFTKALYEHGVFATPVVSPAVPAGMALIRTSYMATHTEDDLDYVAEVFKKLGKQFGLIR